VLGRPNWYPASMKVRGPVVWGDLVIPLTPPVKDLFRGIQYFFN